MAQILLRFGEQNLTADARWTIFANVWDGIWNYFPVGAGVGTFIDVYPLHERIADLTPALFNRAITMVSRRCSKAVRRPCCFSLASLSGSVLPPTALLSTKTPSKEDRPGRGHCDVALLIHSLWDYPLRTIALEALFCFCAALQYAPPSPSHFPTHGTNFGRSRVQPDRRIPVETGKRLA